MSFGVSLESRRDRRSRRFLYFHQCPWPSLSRCAGKIVSSVCHGPAFFVQGAKNPEGEPLVSGKNVKGFSNNEEEAVGKTKLVPWLLEVRYL